MTQHYLCFLLFPSVWPCACSETSHTPIPTCMRFGSALSRIASPISSSSPYPPHKTAIDADWRSCWGITTKRWRVCMQLKTRYWPSSVSQRVPLTGPGDERKWASDLSFIPSRQNGYFCQIEGSVTMPHVPLFFSRGLERFRKVFEKNPQPPLLPRLLSSSCSPICSPSLHPFLSKWMICVVYAWLKLHGCGSVFFTLWSFPLQFLVACITVDYF